MSFDASSLQSELLDAGQALGLIDGSGNLDPDWFDSPVGHLESILADDTQRAALDPSSQPGWPIWAHVAEWPAKLPVRSDRPSAEGSERSGVARAGRRSWRHRSLPLRPRPRGHRSR